MKAAKSKQKRIRCLICDKLKPRAGAVFGEGAVSCKECSSRILKANKHSLIKYTDKYKSLSASEKKAYIVSRGIIK